MQESESFLILVPAVSFRVFICSIYEMQGGQRRGGEKVNECVVLQGQYVVLLTGKAYGQFGLGKQEYIYIC